MLLVNRVYGPLEKTGMDLLDKAIEAHRNALEVRTRKDLPQDWAATQDNLGNAFREKGMRTAGKEGMDLLDKAIEAHRNALEVRTRKDLPQKWAITQNNLGISLTELGSRKRSYGSSRPSGRSSP